MKIGTLTYHRADNYGAVLQAYALCQYLCDQGCNAENIDYWPKHHAVVYKLWCWEKKYFHFQGIRGKIKYLWNFPFILSKNYRRKRKFDIFRKQMMKIVPIRADYDAVFYGSDTIWNRWNLNALYTGFDSTYWGSDTIAAKHRFSYAPSMGNVIDNDGTKNQCKKYLQLFDKISVREVPLKKKFEEWGFKNICITVDPTMLLSRNSWHLLASQRIVKDEYILLYNLERSEVCKELAAKIEREKEMRIIQLTALVSKVGSKDIYDTAGPLEFLSLICHASYVVTSSFHGCVFSIIFNKQFCFHSEVETERISSLLQSSGLQERFIKTPDTATMYRPINYDQVNILVEKEITSSKHFIADCLKIFS